jgi:hypothetical protein
MPYMCQYASWKGDTTSSECTTVTSCTITYMYFPAFKTASALKSYLHKLDDDDQPKLTAGIVAWTTLTLGGAAPHGLSRDAVHVSTAVSVRPEIDGLEITWESLSRGHWMLQAYGQISSQLLSEASSTSYWHAYYWLHLHMRWCMIEIEKSMDDGCYSDLVGLIFS